MKKKSASFTGILVREIIRFLVNRSERDMLFDLPKIKEKEVSFKVPEGYSYQVYEKDGIHVEVLKTDGGRCNKVVLQLHGGGYIEGLDNARRKMSLRYSRISGGAVVVMVDYRTAPEHVFPAALEDGLNVWDWLMEQGYHPENIIVEGDSAGGNLALSLIMLLRDRGRELPAALYLMSPWTDFAAEGKSYSERAKLDPIFSKTMKNCEKEGVRWKRPLYAGNTDLHDPGLSPAYGSFNSFPPMLIQTGTYEILLSDSETIYEKAKKEGVECTLTLYEGMFHAFQFGGDLFRESRYAWKEAGEFIRKHFKDR